MGSPLDLGGELIGRERADARRPRRGSTTSTRLERSPGSGTSVNGPVAGVEFGRAVLVRPLVAKIEGERGLPIGLTVGRDAGGLPAQRAAAVGADRQRGGDAIAVPEPDDDAACPRSRPSAPRPR